MQNNLKDNRVIDGIELESFKDTVKESEILAEHTGTDIYIFSQPAQNQDFNGTDRETGAKDILLRLDNKLDIIKSIYSGRQNQTTVSFWVAIGMSIACLALIVLAVLFLAVFNWGVLISLIPAVCSCLAGFIAHTALAVYQDSSTKLNSHLEILHEDERYYESIVDVDKLSTEKDRDELRKEIIRNRSQKNLEDRKASNPNSKKSEQ